MKQKFIYLYFFSLILFLFNQTYLEDFKIIFIINWCLFVILFLIPPVLYNMHKDFKKLYSQGTQKIINIIFISGFIFLLFYLIQSKYLLGSMIYDYKYINHWDMIEKFKNMSQVLYLLSIFVLILTSFIFLFTKNQINNENRKNKYVKNIVIQMSILISFLVLLNYVAQLKPISFDLSTSKKYSLSKEGKNVVKNIKPSIKITGFFPFFHDFYREVNLFLTDMKSINPNIDFQLVDVEKNRNISEEKKVYKNGVILIENLENDSTKKVHIDHKKKLKTLEIEIIKALLSVSGEKKNIYLTSTHGEYSENTSFNDESIKILSKELNNQNYKIKLLYSETGFPPSVPQNTDLVMILGPERGFAEQEQKALLKYIQGGGSILLLLDPNYKKVNFSFLLEKFNLEYKPHTLLSEYSIKDQPYIITSKYYAEHPIVRNLYSEVEDRKKLSFFIGAGVLQKNQEKEQQDVKITSLIKTNSKTWEKKSTDAKEYDLAILGERKFTNNKEGKLIVFADSHFITDPSLIYSSNNLFILMQSIQWLTHDKKIFGILPKELNSQNIKLSKTEKQIVFWFLVLIWPLLLFFIAYIVLKYYKSRKQS